MNDAMLVIGIIGFIVAFVGLFVDWYIGRNI